jgi:hypothetical protein
MAKSLLMDALQDMKASENARREMGSMAAKYIENLQRSNEQMVKLASLLQRQTSVSTGLSADDKEQLFDLLNENLEEEE